MRALVMAVAALGLAGSAWAQQADVPKNAPSNVSRLIQVRNAQQKICLGLGSHIYDDPKMGCERRAKIDRDLRAAGWCLGQMATNYLDARWERCVTSPSFDCRKATAPDDRLICTDSDLMADDRIFKRLYLHALSVPRNESLRGDVQANLAERKKCRSSSCIAEWFAQMQLQLLAAGGDDSGS